MGGLLGLILLFSLLYGGLALLAALATQWLFKKSVTERHEALDEIVETGCVPRAWRDSRERRSRVRLTGRIIPTHEGSGQPLQVRDVHLRQLARLRRYVKVSSAVDSEETRQSLLQRIDEVGSTWRSNEL